MAISRRDALCFSEVRLPRQSVVALISTKVSAEIGLLSGLTLLDFGMALSTAVLIEVTIKSAYLSKSLVDRSPEKSAEPSASSSVDSNTSRSVWSNMYLLWLVYVFLCGGGEGFC